MPDAYYSLLPSIVALDHSSGQGLTQIPFYQMRLVPVVVTTRSIGRAYIGADRSTGDRVSLPCHQVLE